MINEHLCDYLETCLQLSEYEGLKRVNYLKVWSNEYTKFPSYRPLLGCKEYPVAMDLKYRLTKENSLKTILELQNE